VLGHLNPGEGVPGSTAANLTRVNAPARIGSPPSATSRSAPAGSITRAKTTRSRPRATARDLLPIGGPRRGFESQPAARPARQIHPNDLRSLSEFRRILDATFASDLARTARPHRQQRAGAAGARPYLANNLVDANRATYWATDDSVTTRGGAGIRSPRTFNVVSLREVLSWASGSRRLRSMPGRTASGRIRPQRHQHPRNRRARPARGR